MFLIQKRRKHEYLAEYTPDATSAGQVSSESYWKARHQTLTVPPGICRQTLLEAAAGLVGNIVDAGVESRGQQSKVSDLRLWRTKTDLLY